VVDTFKVIDNMVRLKYVTINGGEGGAIGVGTDKVLA